MNEYNWSPVDSNGATSSPIPHMVGLSVIVRKDPTLGRVAAISNGTNDIEVMMVNGPMIHDERLQAMTFVDRWTARTADQATRYMRKRNMRENAAQTIELTEELERRIAAFRRGSCYHCMHPLAKIRHDCPNHHDVMDSDIAAALTAAQDLRKVRAHDPDPDYRYFITALTANLLLALNDAEKFQPIQEAQNMMLAALMIATNGDIHSRSFFTQVQVQDSNALDAMQEPAPYLNVVHLEGGE